MDSLPLSHVGSPTPGVFTVAAQGHTTNGWQKASRENRFPGPTVVTTLVIQQHHLVVVPGTSLEEGAGPNTPGNNCQSTRGLHTQQQRNSNTPPEQPRGPLGSGRDGLHVWGPFLLFSWSHSTPSLLYKSCDLLSRIELIERSSAPGQGSQEWACSLLSFSLSSLIPKLGLGDSGEHSEALGDGRASR